MVKVTIKNTFVNIDDEFPSEGWGIRQMSEPASVNQHLEPRFDGHAASFSMGDVFGEGRNINFSPAPRGPGDLGSGSAPQRDDDDDEEGLTSKSSDDFESPPAVTGDWQRVVTEELWQDAGRVEVASVIEASGRDPWRSNRLDLAGAIRSSSEATGEKWSSSCSSGTSAGRHDEIVHEARAFAGTKIPTQMTRSTEAFEVSYSDESETYPSDAASWKSPWNSNNNRAQGRSRYKYGSRKSLIDIAMQQQQERQIWHQQALERQHARSRCSKVQGSDGKCRRCGSSTKPIHKFCSFCGASLG
jgi:hypothetical protein